MTDPQLNALFKAIVLGWALVSTGRHANVYRNKRGVTFASAQDFCEELGREKVENKLREKGYPV